MLVGKHEPLYCEMLLKMNIHAKKAGESCLHDFLYAELRGST